MMRDVLLLLAVMILAVIMCVFIVWSNIEHQPPVKKIDCTWSEISPDFSPAMREACRKARTQ